MLHIAVVGDANSTFPGKTQTYLYNPATPTSVPEHIIDQSTENNVVKVLPLISVTWNQFVAWGGQ